MYKPMPELNPPITFNACRFKRSNSRTRANDLIALGHNTNH